MPQRAGHGQNQTPTPAATATASLVYAQILALRGVPGDAVADSGAPDDRGAAAVTPRGMPVPVGCAAGNNASSGIDASCLSILASSFSQSRCVMAGSVEARVRDGVANDE